jgi:ankyrin repeat protein
MEGNQLQFTAEEQAEIDWFIAEYGNDVNAVDTDGKTLLHKAAELGKISVVKYLVSNGADIHARTKDGEDDTPLHLAVKIGNIDVVQFLVSNGADVLARDCHYWTPLDVANMPYKPEVITCLKQAKEYRERNDEEREVVADQVQFTAEEREKIDRYIVKIAKKLNCSVDEVKAKGITLLHCAVSLGMIEVVKQLISTGAKVNAKDDEGWTPLHIAARYQPNVDILKYLVLQGANIKAKKKHGIIPLHLAAYKGNVEITEFLISQGTDIDVKDTNDWTPLLWAVAGESIETVKFLVSLGVDIRAKDKDGNTPLHLAAYENKNAEIVKYLISIGASITVKDKRGRTPLAIARKEKNTAVVECLECLEWGWGFGGYNINDDDPVPTSTESVF